jgi:hypothetical protein
LVLGCFWLEGRSYREPALAGKVGSPHLSRRSNRSGLKNRSERSRLAPESQLLQDVTDAALFKCYGLTDSDVHRSTFEGDVVSGNIPQREIKLLCMKSGGVCAFPRCGKYLIVPGVQEDGSSRRMSIAMTAVGIADPAVSHAVQGLRTAYGALAKAGHFIDKYTQK